MKWRDEWGLNMSHRDYPYEATELYRILLNSVKSKEETIGDPKRGERRDFTTFTCDCKIRNQMTIPGNEPTDDTKRHYEKELARTAFFHILKLCGLDEIDLQDLMMVRSILASRDPD